MKKRLTLYHQQEKKSGRFLHLGKLMESITKTATQLKGGPRSRYQVISGYMLIKNGEKEKEERLISV